MGEQFVEQSSLDADVPAPRNEFNKDDFPTLGIPATSTLISSLTSLFSFAIAFIDPTSLMSWVEHTAKSGQIQTYEGSMQRPYGSGVRWSSEVYFVVKVSL